MRISIDAAYDFGLLWILIPICWLLVSALIKQTRTNRRLDWKLFFATLVFCIAPSTLILRYLNGPNQAVFNVQSVWFENRFGSRTSAVINLDEIRSVYVSKYGMRDDKVEIGILGEGQQIICVSELQNFRAAKISKSKIFAYLKSKGFDVIDETPGSQYC